MRIAVLLLALPLFAFAAAMPAGAQQAKDPKDQILEDEDAAKSDAAQEANWILQRPLPYKDGQTLKYYNNDGTYVGYAERRRLTIYFYDDKGLYVGKAVRVSQQATRYFTADGTFLGRRLHKKMTLAKTNYDNGGFNQGNPADALVGQ